MSVIPASIGSSISSFLDAAGKFFSSLAAIHWGALLLALLFFGASLSVRSRAAFNVLRAAFPGERILWRRIWGAYVAAFGTNAVIPARAGDVVRLFLVRTSVPNSTYPAIASSFLVENIFDTAIGILVLIFAFTQGVFPKPPDFSKIPAFDLQFFAAHLRFTLFLITLLGILALVAFAVLSARVRAFWAHVSQGVTILRDRPRYLRQVFALQLAGWLLRFTAFYFMLDAFNIGGSVRNVLLVFGVNAVAAFVPFTPGGAGVQQALLVKVFVGTADAATVAAYSVGQQAAIAAFTFAVGFTALVTIFRFRSIKEVIGRGRAEQAAEAAAARGAV